MTDSGHGMPLVRRVFAEYRRTLVPLLVMLVVNIVAYAAIVMPLAQRVANIEQRDADAERELAEARKDYEDARGTLTGKDRAAKELETFYTNVLPKDLQTARRLWQRRIPQLADNLDVLVDRRTQTPVQDRDRDSRLVRLTSEVELAGRYNDLRTFIHRLETSPEFVVIDTIELVEGEQETGLLEVTLFLSTYYRTAAP